MVSGLLRSVDTMESAPLKNSVRHVTRCSIWNALADLRRNDLAGLGLRHAILQECDAHEYADPRFN